MQSPEVVNDDVRGLNGGQTQKRARPVCDPDLTARSARYRKTRRHQAGLRRAECGVEDRGDVVPIGGHHASAHLHQ